MTKNPITRNTFRHCRERFCWTTFLETAVVYCEGYRQGSASNRDGEFFSFVIERLTG